APYSATPLAPGTYGVTVTDQLSGCFTTTTASINDDAFTVDATPVGTCDPIFLSVTTTPAQTAVSYRVVDNATAQVVDSGNMPSGNFSTLPLPSDNRTYVVEVEADGTGCVQSSLPIIVDQNDEVQVNITADICSDPITISVDAGTSWSWTGPNIDGVNDQSSITATPPQGLNVYNLHVEDGVLCPLDTAITVNVDNNVAPALAQSSACDDQVVVTATPSGQFLYRWYRNGAIDNTLAGPQAIATNDGDTYRVEI